MEADNLDGAGVGDSPGDSAPVDAAGTLPTSVEIPSPTKSAVDPVVGLSAKGEEVPQTSTPSNAAATAAAAAVVPLSTAISTVTASTAPISSRSNDEQALTAMDTSLSTSTKDCEDDEGTKCSDSSTTISGSSKTSPGVASTITTTTTMALDESTVKDRVIQLLRYLVEFEERPKQPMMFNRPYTVFTCDDHFYKEESRRINSQSATAMSTHEPRSGSQNSTALTLEEIDKHLESLDKLGPTKKPYQDLAKKLGVNFSKSLTIQKLKDRIKAQLDRVKEHLLTSAWSANSHHQVTSSTNEQQFGSEAAFQVFLSSYDVQECLDFLCGKDGSITIPSLQFDYEKWDSKPLAPTPEVTLYLSSMHRQDPSRFNQNMSVDDIVPLLEQHDIERFHKHVAGAAQTEPRVVKYMSDFLESCVIRNNFKKAFTTARKQLLQSIYDLLDQWRLRNESGESVLLLGLGNVRMRSFDKDKADNFVNGPPLEYVLDLERVDEAFVLRPKKHTNCVINWEVETAMTSKNTSEEWAARLRKKALLTAAEEIRPNDPSTFKDLLVLVANNARCSIITPYKHQIKCSRAEQSTKVFVTDAFCVYEKPIKTTPQSKDSRQLISALQNGEREIHEPLRWLASNVGYEPAPNENVVDEDDIVFPLPIDEIQRQTAVSLFCGGCPVQVVEGPPGCGKTSVTANTGSAAVAQKKTVLVSSPNKNALKAYYDRLPKPVQEVTLDLSNLENAEKDSTDSLEKLLDLTRGDNSDLADRTKRLKQWRLKIKGEMENKRLEFRAHRSISHDLLIMEDGALQKVLDSNLSMTVPWLMNGLLNGKIRNIPRAIETLENFKPADYRMISLKVPPENVLNKDVLDVARTKLTESQEAKSLPSFSFGAVSEPEKKLLQGIEINHRIPSSQADWKCIVDFIEFRMLCSEFLECGCPENIFTTPETSSELISVLRVVSDFEILVKSCGKNIEKLVYRTEKMGMSHKEYRDLTQRLQTVESNLVGLQVKESLIERIDADGLNALQTALHILERSTAEEKEADFPTLLKKILKYFPLVIMRLDQVAKFIPPDESRDLAIIDESSQASCLAINLLVRAKSMLIVGDNNQVNPPTIGLSLDLKRLLQRSTPDIPGRVQLGPNYSFMHLASATYYPAVRNLLYHYRCDPQIIAICNQIFYKGRLIALRPANMNVKAIHVIRVEGTRQENGVNEEEAERTASIMFTIIIDSKELSKPPTLAVIVATGQDAALKQCAQIQELLTKKLQVEGLNYRTCEARHQILMGSASRMQGNERNIALINLVNSPKTKKNGGGLSLLRKTDGDQRKEYNVIFSRASDEAYVIHSFGPENLHPGDVRQEIFQHLSEPMAGSTDHLSTSNSGMVEDDQRFFVFFMFKIAEELTKHGFSVERMSGGPIWSNGWRVDAAGRADGSNCVYLHPEHYGESEKEWNTIFDQQIALERAGRKCLRIDSLTASLNFPKVMDDILDYLKNQGLPINEKALEQAQKEAGPETPTKAKQQQSDIAAELAVEDDSSPIIDRNTDVKVVETEDTASAKRNASGSLVTDSNAKKQKMDE